MSLAHRRSRSDARLPEGSAYAAKNSYEFSHRLRRANALIDALDRGLLRANALVEAERGPGSPQGDAALLLELHKFTPAQWALLAAEAEIGNPPSAKTIALVIARLRERAAKGVRL